MQTQHSGKLSTLSIAQKKALAFFKKSSIGPFHNLNRTSRRFLAAYLTVETGFSRDMHAITKPVNKCEQGARVLSEIM